MPGKTTKIRTKIDYSSILKAFSQFKGLNIIVTLKKDLAYSMQH